MSPNIMFDIPALFSTGTFWLALLAALVGAAWWVLRAGARGQSLEADRADLQVYQDQIAEVERDLVQGRISPEAAQAGRLEIGRRLVQARDRVLQDGPRLNRFVLTAVAASIALGSGGLYLFFGSPHKADQPFAAREAELLSRAPETLNEDEVMLLLQEQARKVPTDPKPHALMAQVLSGAGRDQDALRAYQAALRRDPNNADLIAETGAVLMRLNRDVVGPDAEAAFEAALKLDPSSANVRFYLGLADWQAGRKAEALSAWREAFVANAAKKDAQRQLVFRVADVLSQLDRGPSDAAAGGAGPMAGMANASPEEQKAFIETMVASRVERLTSNPSDPSLRLSAARVLLMTGKFDQARQVLSAGQALSSKDPLMAAIYDMALKSVPPPGTPVFGSPSPEVIPKR